MILINKVWKDTEVLGWLFLFLINSLKEDKITQNYNWLKAFKNGHNELIIKAKLPPVLRF